MLKQYTFAIFFSFQAIFLCAQVDTVILTEQSFIEYDNFFSAYSGTFDKNDDRYIYTATKELGLLVYEIINGELVEIGHFDNTNFNNLKVTNVDQAGNYLYLLLGDFQGFGSDVGIAVLNVLDPEDISIEGLWSTDAFDKGGAILKVVEDYAYLGMMDSGLAIVNVANPDSMYYVAHVVPDYFFPVTPGLFDRPHTRGMAIREDVAFLCADAGGLRVIDIADKSNPTEEYKYVNDYVLNNAGRAYNNLLIDGNIAYIALDYCGLEVLDISDPFDPQPLALFNLWDCGNSDWEGGTGHMNELAKAPDQDILFVSSGDSEVMALDISTPADPRVIGQFGGLQDSIASWGLSLSGNKIALFQLNNSGIPDFIPQPFYSDQGGVKLLEWDLITATHDFYFQHFKVYPNPFVQSVDVRLPENAGGDFQFKLFNQLGQLLYTKKIKASYSSTAIPFDFSLFPEGVYFLSIENGGGVYTQTLVKL